MLAKPVLICDGQIVGTTPTYLGLDLAEQLGSYDRPSLVISTFGSVSGTDLYIEYESSPDGSTWLSLNFWSAPIYLFDGYLLPIPGWVSGSRLGRFKVYLGGAGSPKTNLRAWFVGRYDTANPGFVGHYLVINEFLRGGVSVVSDPALNEVLGTSDDFCVVANVSTCRGTTCALEVSYEFSVDGRSWSSSIALGAQTLTPGASGVLMWTASDQTAFGCPGFRLGRFRAILTGTGSPNADVKIYVTTRTGYVLL